MAKTCWVGYTKKKEIKSHKENTSLKKVDAE